MRDWPWIPPWIPVKSSVCARYDCTELRHETETGVRRYCERHAKEYDVEVSGLKEFLRTCKSSQRA